MKEQPLVALPGEKALTVTVNISSVMEADAKVLKARIESATVESDEGYITLTDALGQVKRRRDAWAAEKKKVKAPALELCKTLETLYETPIGILDAVILGGKAKLLAYDALKKAEADAKAALAAQALAEAATREEEAKRVAAEAVALAARTATAAAQAAQASAEATTTDTKLDNERLRKEAVTARVAQLKAERIAGDAVAALDVAQGATQTIIEARAAPTLVRAAGADRRKVWGWNVTDIAKVDRKWLTLDVKAIDKVVTEHKDKALEVLGEGFGVMYENAIGLTPNRGGDQS